mgnify:CR=1 FL=1
MKQIITNDIRKINDKYYNMILDKPLKGGEKTNIQYIIEVEGTYGIASLKPMTLKEVENIKLNNYNFKPFREIMKGSNKNEN